MRKSRPCRWIQGLAIVALTLPLVACGGEKELGAPIVASEGGFDGAVTVIFYAADGYSSSLTLDFVRDNDILLAYKMNDITLPVDRGFPFEVLAESKWGYKWVRWVTEIQLTSNADYKGYWESLGYNNDGDLDGPKFGE